MPLTPVQRSSAWIQLETVGTVDRKTLQISQHWAKTGLKRNESHAPPPPDLCLSDQELGVDVLGAHEIRESLRPALPGGLGDAEACAMTANTRVSHHDDDLDSHCWRHHPPTHPPHPPPPSHPARRLATLTRARPRRTAIRTAMQGAAGDIGWNSQTLTAGDAMERARCSRSTTVIT